MDMEQTNGFAITTGVWLRSHTNNDIIVTISYLDKHYRFIFFLHNMMIKMKKNFTNNNQIDGLVQDWHNSIANALESRFSCTNPSRLYLIYIYI